MLAQIELRLEIDGGPYYRTVGEARVSVAEVMRSSAGKVADSWPLLAPGGEARGGQLGGDADGAADGGGGGGDGGDGGGGDGGHAALGSVELALRWRRAPLPGAGWSRRSVAEEAARRAGGAALRCGEHGGAGGADAGGATAARAAAGQDDAQGAGAAAGAAASSANVVSLDTDSDTSSGSGSESDE